MILLDASALLAMLREEVGADMVTTALEEEQGAITVVNLAEVLEHGAKSGVADLNTRLGELHRAVDVVPVTEEDALGVARLYPSTRRPALSLADRFCLSVAQRLGVPVLTAERAWADVPGIEVRLIRP